MVLKFMKKLLAWAVVFFLILSMAYYVKIQIFDIPDVPYEIEQNIFILSTIVLSLGLGVSYLIWKDFDSGWFYEGIQILFVGSFLAWMEWYRMSPWFLTSQIITANGILAYLLRRQLGKGGRAFIIVHIAVSAVYLMWVWTEKGGDVPSMETVLPVCTVVPVIGMAFAWGLVVLDAWTDRKLEAYIREWNEDQDMF